MNVGKQEGNEKTDRSHLCECHAGDDGEHDLLSFGGVGVLLVLLQPGLQSAGGLPGGRLGPRRVPVRVLAVRVEALGGVDGQGGWVGPGTVLQLILGTLSVCRGEGDNLMSDRTSISKSMFAVVPKVNLELVYIYIYIYIFFFFKQLNILCKRLKQVTNPVIVVISFNRI